MVENKWKCIFVDYIEPNNRILLTKKRGVYTPKGGKSTSSVPQKMYPSGKTKESKFIKLLALATYYNRNELNNSNGLLIKSEGKENAIVASKSEKVKGHIKNKTAKGTATWIAYISPNRRYYHVEDRKKKEEVSKDIQDEIKKAIEYAENNLSEKSSRPLKLRNNDSDIGLPEKATLAEAMEAKKDFEIPVYIFSLGFGKKQFIVYGDINQDKLIDVSKKHQKLGDKYEKKLFIDLDKELDEESLFERILQNYVEYQTEDIELWQKIKEEKYSTI